MRTLAIRDSTLSRGIYAVQGVLGGGQQDVDVHVGAYVRLFVFGLYCALWVVGQRS